MKHTFSSSSLVQGPLTRSGSRTLNQRCWHWCSDRLFMMKQRTCLMETLMWRWINVWQNNESLIIEVNTLTGKKPAMYFQSFGPTFSTSFRSLSSWKTQYKLYFQQSSLGLKLDKPWDGKRVHLFSHQIKQPKHSCIKKYKNHRNRASLSFTYKHECKR